MPRSNRSPLYVFNGGFLRPRIRRILSLAGYDLRLGWPTGPIGVWGRSPTAQRGETMARRAGVPLIRIEDAWLRSLFPGRAGDAPMGLLIDQTGVHFDASAPSDLETLLATHPFDDTPLLTRAEGAIATLIETGLTKYAATDPALALPDPGYVLVVDQTRGDASVTSSRGDRNRFLEMLFVAQEEHPGARIVIKTHPETARGLRPGHFTAEDTRDHVSFCDTPVDPWALLKGAVAVYTLSSQMGFEAILAGHRPRVFGQPFYASWGLSDDETPVARRQRRLTRTQLFAGAALFYPTWYDPARDRLCSFEDTAAQLAAEARAWREDRHGWTADGMRLWKRPALQKFYGRHKPVTFNGAGSPRMVWAGKPGADQADMRIEDGFLRSQGLGAELVPPLSLVGDDLGIYYDPARPSRLEHLIAARADLRPDQTARARALMAQITEAGLTKYNLSGAHPDLPPGYRILVPGQVEDDASVLRGCCEHRTNAALLAATRAAHPEAVILYKPHPDVEAGLRPGAIPATEADVILRGADPNHLLTHVDEVWTLTSLLGFEALLRGVSVTVLGAPFYAGWGLTRDLGDPPTRRQAKVSLPGLVHAVLIDYPRYRDPISGLPCPAEVIAERLATGVPRPGPVNRSLSKLQGLLASQSWLWR